MPILLKSGDGETSVCQKGLEHLEHKRQEVATCRRYDKEMKDGYSEIIATISQEMEILNPSRSPGVELEI